MKHAKKRFVLLLVLLAAVLCILCLPSCGGTQERRYGSYRYIVENGEVTITESGDVAGQKISQWSGIVVPLKRNMETIIEGRMLTTSFGTGGFGIDPSFENEFVIPWGD